MEMKRAYEASINKDTKNESVVPAIDFETIIKTESPIEKLELEK